MEVNWNTFKTFVNTRVVSIQYVTVESNYWMQAIDGPFYISCLIPTDPANPDTAEFLATYIVKANQSYTDSDGRPITKFSVARKGATYLSDCCEVTTAQGILSEKWDKSAGNYSVKFYNSSNVEITGDLSTCVMTVVNYAPTYDYEIISGKVHQASAATDNVRFWVIGGCTDLSHIPGLTKEFVANVNLKYVQGSLVTDGRASKFMTYTTAGVPYPTNKLRFIFTHPVGHAHSLLITVESYR